MGKVTLKFRNTYKYINNAKRVSLWLIKENNACNKNNYDLKEINLFIPFKNSVEFEDLK